MQTMCVGGRATHWGAECPRYSPEDFRAKSLTGVGEDWPISYEDIEPYYAQVESLIGVSRTETLDGDTRKFQRWAATAGIDPGHVPAAVDGNAAYSPVVTLRRLLKNPRVQLVSRTLIRRLELEPKSNRIARATGVDMKSATPVSVSAKYFLLAGSYVWTPHLLLLSACSRFPSGLANGSGLVGKYITGHPELATQFEIADRLHHPQAIYSSQFLAVAADGPPTRFGTFLYYSLAGGRDLRIRAEDDQIMLGDQILEDWRAQRPREHGSVYFKSYLGVTASPRSRLVLDGTRKNRWGDPLPVVNNYANQEATAIWRDPPRRLQAVIDRLRQHSIRQETPLQDNASLHPSGSCRMGVDPSSSVCDKHGRCHEHENLVLLGAPTCVSGGCVNATLTFAALALRSAVEVGKDFPQRTKIAPVPKP